MAGDDVVIGLAVEERRALAAIRSFLANVASGLKALPDVDLDVNEREAIADIQQVQDRLDSLTKLRAERQIRISVGADTSALDAKIADTERLLRQDLAQAAQRSGSAISGSFAEAARESGLLGRSLGEVAREYGNTARAALEAARRGDLKGNTEEARRLASAVLAAGAAYHRELTRAAADAQAAGHSTAGIERELRDVEQELQDLQAKVPIFRRLGGEAERAALKLGKIEDEAGRSRRGLAGLELDFRSAAARIGLVTGAVAGLAAGAGFAAQRLWSLTAPAREAALQVDQLRRQLNAAAGDAEVGGRVYAFVERRADELGFSFLGLADDTRKWIAATRESTFTERERLDILDAVLVAARANGATDEQRSRALEALSQIVAKTVVSQEELRQQLGEAIPGASQAMARGLGLTVLELNELIESGSLAAERALPALATGLRDSAAAGLDEALQSNAVALARFDNTWTRFKASFGEGFTAAQVEAAQQYGDRLEALEPAANRAGEALGRLATKGAALPISFGEWLAQWARPDSPLQRLGELLSGVNDELDDVAASAPTELSGVIDEAAEAAARLERELRNAAAREKAVLGELFGNREEVEQQAAALTGTLAAIFERNIELNEAQKEAVKEAVQETLDALELLGIQTGPLLKRYANELQVMSSAEKDAWEKATKAAEKAAEAEERAVEKRRKAIAALRAELVEFAAFVGQQGGENPLAAQLAELEAERAALAGKPLLDPEEATRLAEVTDAIANLRQETSDLGEAYAGTAVEVAQVDDLIAKLAKSGREALTGLPDSARESVAAILSGLRQTAAEGQATQDTVAAALRGVGQALDEASGYTTNYTQSISSALEAGSSYEDALQAIRRGAEEVGEGHKLGAEGIEESEKALAKNRREVDKTEASLSKLAKRTTENLETIRRRTQEELPVVREEWDQLYDVLEKVLKKCEEVRRCFASLAG